MGYFKKIISGRIPLGHAFYRLFNKLHLPRIISLFFYKLFFEKKKNKLDKSVQNIDIKTYDRFNQCTHPDVLLYNGLVMLVLTPYPYSDEKYENPCLYYMSENGVFLPFCKNPVVDYDKRSVRHHYSDPALMVVNNQLHLFYRDSIHNKDDRKDIIHQSILSQDNMWHYLGEINYHGQHCISPSFLSLDSKTYMYYVVDYGEETKLYLSEVANNSVISSVILDLDFDTDMQIWHVDVKKHHDNYYGLFTFMEKAGYGETRLYLFTSKDGLKWKCVKEITFGEASNVKNLYKSTSIFLDEQVRIIVSALDNHGRWKMYFVNGVF